MPCIWVQYGPVVCHHSCSWNIEMVNELIGTLRGIIKKHTISLGLNRKALIWPPWCVKQISSQCMLISKQLISDPSVSRPGPTYSKQHRKIPGFSRSIIYHWWISWFCQCKLTMAHPYISQKSKILSVTRQTWTTIHSDTYLSPKNNLQFKCFRKSSQRLGKTLDTLKPAKKWARSAGFLRIATWWCLPQAPWFHKTKCHLTDLKCIYSFILHEIPGVELYEIPGVELYEIPGVEPMWTSSTVPSSHAIDLCAWCWRRPRHGRVLAPTRPDRNRGNQREGQSLRC